MFMLRKFNVVAGAGFFTHGARPWGPERVEKVV